MDKEKVINDYFDWLYAIVTVDNYEKRLFRRLLMTLHSIPFRYSVNQDSNRESDGLSLRWRFAQDTGRDWCYKEISECLSGPCSVLEMLIGLALKCEETIMDDPKYGNRTAQWFWKMINNLGLGTMYNGKYDKKLVNVVVEKFLNREYDRNGRGGLFTIKNCAQDLRKVDIWTQLCWYVDNIYI